jgi:predicted O-methyltransferase YrrM
MTETFPVEDDILRSIRKALVNDAMDGIQVGEPDARLLQFLARLSGAKSVVEVGTLYGYSTLCWARAIPRDGVVYSVDVNETHHKRAAELLKPAAEWAKIKLITGDAKEKLKELSSKGPFDIVFIDANKSGYLDYLDWAEENVRVGGLIIGDNTFLFDALFGISRDPNMGEKQKAVMREFNKRLANPERYNSAIIPTGEGITVAQRLA